MREISVNKKLLFSFMFIAFSAILFAACSSNSSKNDADSVTPDGDTIVTCERGGVTYQVGDTIQIDSCNHCDCEKSGDFTCTKILCDDADYIIDEADVLWPDEPNETDPIDNDSLLVDSDTADLIAIPDEENDDEQTDIAPDIGQPDDMSDTGDLDIDQSDDETGDLSPDTDISLPDNDSFSRTTKQWGTSEEDNGKAVAVDGNGNVFVVGDTSGALDGNTNAGGTCGMGPCPDIFLIKWNTAIP